MTVVCYCYYSQVLLQSSVTTVKCYYSQVLLQSSKHCLIGLGCMVELSVADGGVVLLVQQSSKHCLIRL